MNDEKLGKLAENTSWTLRSYGSPLRQMVEDLDAAIMKALLSESLDRLDFELSPTHLILKIPLKIPLETTPELETQEERTP